MCQTIDRSTIVPPTTQIQKPTNPYYKFHEGFKKHDGGSGTLERAKINKSFDELNHPSINDKLRTRIVDVKKPLRKPAAEASEYVPSIQKYNRRGKLY